MAELGIHTDIIEFCSEIGSNSLLVQGPGGNISWKEGNILWIKASGKWLGHAAQEEIFVAVKLQELLESIEDRNFQEPPKLMKDQILRPSIETMLHGLMPHKIVLHLHAVDVLVHTLIVDYKERLSELLPNDLNWIAVDYSKPGPQLSESVDSACRLYRLKMPDAVFLGNHGLIIGAENLHDLRELLYRISESLKVHTLANSKIFDFHSLSPIRAYGQEYSPIEDNDLHQLATLKKMFGRIENDWALYPDHIIFLGTKAIIISDSDELEASNTRNDLQPDILFYRDVGVFRGPHFSEASLTQLRCYFDVLWRLPNDLILNRLGKNQVAELVDWEAESYRQTLNE